MYFKNNHDFEVIVSHPHRQASIYQIPLAIQAQGIPVKFLTGLYYKPNQFPYALVKYLPSSRRETVTRQLEKRRLPELKPESVISLGGPWLEMIYRPWALWRLWWKTHDWLVGRWIESVPKSSNPVILHTFDYYVKRALFHAQQRGWIRVLEITLPLITDDLVGEEFRRLGWSNSYKQMPRVEKEKIIEEFRRADFLVAQSRLTVDDLIGLGIPRNRIILMPLGVDIDRFRPTITKFPKHPFRALFAGSLSIRKGLHLVLEAWKQLDLSGAELVLVGSMADRKVISGILERYSGYYRWLGFVDDTQLPGIYQSSDIFILPSFAEGSSNVLHEAMASGLPCIVTTNVGCTLRDGVDGFVIPVGDIDALKDRILQLYHSPELCRTMGAAARARAEQFTWQEYGRRLALAYQFILSGTQESVSKILDMTEL